MQYFCCGELADVGTLCDICLQLTLYKYLNVSGHKRVLGEIGQGGLGMRSSFGNDKKKIVQLWLSSHIM